jgi:hypothetical protein
MLTIYITRWRHQTLGSRFIELSNLYSKVASLPFKTKQTSENLFFIKFIHLLVSDSLLIENISFLN